MTTTFAPRSGGGRKGTGEDEDDDDDDEDDDDDDDADAEEEGANILANMRALSRRLIAMDRAAEWVKFFWVRAGESVLRKISYKIMR